ncbi:MAG: PAS domain S-box protein [Bacillota bacterium]
MTLRQKTLILIIITIVLFTLIACIEMKTVVLSSFARREEDDMRKKAFQAKDMLTDELYHIRLVCSDWATKDETYAFVRNGNSEYGAKLYNRIFERLEINVMVIVNSSGRIVFIKYIDYRNKVELPIPDDLKKHFSTGSPIVGLRNQDSSAGGIILLSRGPLLVASRPILTGDGKGPVAGVMVMGRFLDTVEIEHLAKVSHLAIAVQRLDTGNVPQDFQKALTSINDGAPASVQTLNPDFIAGYVLLKDIYGKPALLLRVESSRDVYKQGQASIIYLILSLLVAGWATGVITLLALEKIIISRLAELIASVSRISEHGDLSTRVSAKGNDELSKLAGEINKMLETIEQSEQLQESEERYRLLFDEALTGNYIALAYGRVLLCNPAYVRMFGFGSLEEALATDFFTLFPDPAAKEAFLQLLRKRKKLELHEATFRRRDGQLITVVQNVIGTFDRRGELLQLQGYLFDITARKKAEEALAQAKRQNEMLLEAVGEGIYGVDPEGRTTFVNPAVLEMTGYTAADMIGRSQHAILHHTRVDGTPYPDAACPIYATVRDGRPRSVTGEVFWRKDGSSFPVEYTCTPVREGEEIVGAVVIFRDITARQQAEQALREAHTQIKQLVASISSILIGLDADGRVKHWNGPAAEAFGLAAEAVVGRLLGANGIEWEWDRVAQGIAACRERGEPVRVDDVRYQRRDGKPGFLGLTVTQLVSEEGKHLGYVILAADITERKNEETQRVLRQKLESLGQLAAGIAHEINTPMQYVGDNTTFLRDAFATLSQFLARCRELPAQAESGVVPASEFKTALAEVDWEFLGAEIPKAVEQSLEGIAQVRKLVLAMKEFAHPGKREKALCNLNRAVESTVTISRNEWKYVADLETDLDPDLPPVPCVVDEINQVVLNTIVNAAHAIATVVDRDAGEKGKITVATRREGDFVKIIISDTGTGIPPAIIDRIFDPFFTTKEVGKGSGQGLAIAHDIIVNKQKGNITVESEVGKGTTFTVWLPLNPPEDEKEGVVRE